MFDFSSVFSLSLTSHTHDRNMRKIFITIFIIVFVMFDNSIGYTDILPVWKHFTYVFQHANIVHLIMNSISFYLVWGALDFYYSKSAIIAIAYLSAVAMSFFTGYSLPVVGASGMIYAMFGMFSFLIIKGRLSFENFSGQLIYWGSVAVFLAISFIRPNQAGMLHLLCLASGMLISYLHSKKNESQN